MISEYKILLAEKEIRDLGLNTRLKEYGKRASVLDLGCGDGFHLEQISRGYSCEITGLDISRDMLDMSSKRFQKLGDKKHSLRLLQNDFEDENAVGSRRFTHICMYYFSFYYSSNQEKLVQNIHTWLEPKGYFAVHLVHPTKFDPIIDAANPFVGFSLNHYRKNDPDAKHSRVYFQNFVYNSLFQYDENKGVANFTEAFVRPQKRTVRYNSHTLTMKSLQDSVNLITRKKFKYVGFTPLTHYGYGNQYIVYFQKK